jgi:hypothetical protein
MYIIEKQKKKINKNYRNLCKYKSNYSIKFVLSLKIFPYSCSEEYYSIHEYII